MYIVFGACKVYEWEYERNGMKRNEIMCLESQQNITVGRCSPFMYVKRQPIYMLKYLKLFHAYPNKSKHVSDFYQLTPIVGILFWPANGQQQQQQHEHVHTKAA